MKKSMSAAKFYRKYGIMVIFIVLFIVSAIINHNFLKPQNLINILTQISVVTMIACGETMLIVSGQLDLSAGLMCTGSACFSAGVLVFTGSVPLAIIVGLGFGAICGWINGFLVSHFHLQSFIATLAMTNIIKGMVQLYTNGQAISGVEKISWLGQGKVLQIPVPVIVMLLCVLVTSIIMKRTQFGEVMYALGGNTKAAVASGINTGRSVRKVFMLSGIITGLAGLVLMARLTAGMPSVGEGYEFDAITGSVVGGTSFLGGIGSVGGALAGSIIVGLINNILNLLHVSTQYQLIAKGILIASAVIIDVKTKEDKKSL